MTIWFTADPHFSHANIIKLCNRPFNNVSEMNEHLVDSYNRYVKPYDTLYILGDFGWGDADSLIKIREEIRCDNIIFIWGNHDKSLKASAYAQHRMFKSVHDVLDIKVAGQDIVLFHNPILEWTGFWHGAWHLFGHVHGNLSHMPGALAIDVGVDCHDYKPVSFEEVKLIMENRKKFNAKRVEDFVK